MSFCKWHKSILECQACLQKQNAVPILLWLFCLFGWNTMLQIVAQECIFVLVIHAAPVAMCYASYEWGIYPPACVPAIEWPSLISHIPNISAGSAICQNPNPGLKIKSVLVPGRPPPPMRGRKLKVLAGGWHPGFCDLGQKRPHYLAITFSAKSTLYVNPPKGRWARS